ncbi:MAG TPA: MBL fold metallo-hydrolase [Spirochaetes bacterium]|mgnify:CR=1 FL=1|nr:MBL fold metallo-hydrolase [Spirochaetota bacterium]
MVKISVICENTVLTSLRAIGEHGLSLLIESEDTTLFDTGQGFCLLHNMQAFGKDPAAIQRVVISHGHYDHTGGLYDLIGKAGKKMPVYIHPDAFHEKLAVIPGPRGAIEVPIGMQRSRQEYLAAGADFVPAEKVTAVTKGVTAFSSIPRPGNWKGWDDRLKVRSNGVIADDPFNDDLTLLLETASGPVVLLGCAHAGMVDILDYISAETGLKEFHAVIGGTHLGSAPENYRLLAGDTLERYGVKVIATSHCTGLPAACELSQRFGDRFAYACVGSVFEF